MAAPRADSEVIVKCEDYLGFQEALKKMRNVDDRIVYALNTSVPTKSFSDKVNATDKCKQLYEQLQESYNSREKAIKKCINVVSNSIDKLHEEKNRDPDNFEIMKELKKEQTQLRLMQSELTVEEIVKDRSLKVFYERCRNAYRPPTDPPL